MYCMKCGREIEDEQVFCDDCLVEMKKYPVKPDTRVQLPLRNSDSNPKKASPKKRTVSPEERLAGMRKAIGWLSAALAVTVVALALSVAMLVSVTTPDEAESALGQNYSTADQNNDAP